MLCCKRGVDFSMASVRARSASTRERTWSRSEDDILYYRVVFAVLCFFFYFVGRFFLLNEYTSLSSSSSQSQVICIIIASPSINELCLLLLEVPYYAHACFIMVMMVSRGVGCGYILDRGVEVGELVG